MEPDNRRVFTALIGVLTQRSISEINAAMSAAGLKYGWPHPLYYDSLEGAKQEALNGFRVAWDAEQIQNERKAREILVVMTKQLFEDVGEERIRAALGGLGIKLLDDEFEAEPDGREEHTPLKVTPKEKSEDGEENKAAALPKAVPGMTKKSSQKRRRSGPKPAPYYFKLVKLMTLLHEKEFEKFESGTTTDLRDFVKWRFKNDSVKGYPKSRSGLDKAIAKAKREVIDSADRL